MIDSLCDAVYQMTKIHNESFAGLKRCELVMVCSHKAYAEIRGTASDKIFYIRDVPNYQIPILRIIGIDIPVILKMDMPNNVDFQLMFRKDYERLEQEEMYKKLVAMFN